MKNRNQTIDLAKYAASLMVIAIHTSLFSDVNETLNIAVADILCRLAVPFFAVCTGYFTGCGFHFSKDREAVAKNRANFFRQWKKLLVMYAVWSAIYLVFSIPKWIEIGWFSAWAFVDYGIAACTQGSYYHLWYLWGLVCMLPVFYAMLRWVPGKLWPAIIALLWLIKIGTYAYMHMVPDVLAGLMPVLGRMETFLTLLPLLLLGGWISRRKTSPMWLNVSGFLIGFVLLFWEAFWLKSQGQQVVSYIFFTLPTAYFLFCCLVQCPARFGGERISRLAAISMFIYCVHPILIELTKPFVESTMVHFLVCALGATLMGYVYSILKEKQRRKKVMSCFS